MHEQLDINGKIPALTDLVCQELLCQQYWYQGQLEEEANIIYLKFGDVWHRLYFDCSIIFWHSNDSNPVNYQLKDEGYNYPIVDLAQKFDLKGVMLEQLSAKSIEGGSQVSFTFRNRVRVTFQNIGDNTNYKVEHITA